MLRNLHAHNCRGIILSWASLRQPGQGHINNHRFKYVEDQMEALGYWPNDNLTARLRNGPGALGMPKHSWISGNVAAFERYKPIWPCRSRPRCS